MCEWQLLKAVHYDLEVHVLFQIQPQISCVMQAIFF